jgi:FKBP-type peptidyl-prolyl cis-trans isomerase
MKMPRNLSAALLIATLFGCQDSGSASLETDDQKASYAIGLDIGRNFITVESHIDLAALRVGIQDGLAESEQRISQAELEEVMVAFGETMQAESLAAMEAESLRNIEEGTVYLAENGAREGVMTTDTGLQYEVLRESDGDRPEATTSLATIHYRGTLVDGTEFDSSYERDNPAVFPLNGVIPGFSEGLQLMQTGSQYRFVMPADLAYGVAGSPPSIGPNATLVFEVELLEISP